MRIKFTSDHNGYAAGEELDCDPGVADAIVNWARAAVYVVAAAAPAKPPQPEQDKALKPHGGKQKVRTK